MASGSKEKALSTVSIQRAIELFASDTDVLSIGPGMQVTVQCRTDRPSGEQGHFLMELEKELRSFLRLPIEIYFQPRADDSALRQRKNKVLDWVNRRGMLKHDKEDGHESSKP